MKRTSSDTNGALLIVGGLIYAGLLILFGWQTWEFVNWLFPDDQLLMKLLTLLSFDALALFWACLDLFYRFSDPRAKTLVKWAWGITFILSLLASILYLIISSMFRFHVSISASLINIGYGISIAALTYNILSLMFWLYLEWNAQHPHLDQFEQDVSNVPLTPQSVERETIPVEGPKEESVTAQPEHKKQTVKQPLTRLHMLKKSADLAPIERVRLALKSEPDCSDRRLGTLTQLAPATAKKHRVQLESRQAAGG